MKAGVQATAIRGISLATLVMILAVSLAGPPPAAAGVPRAPRASVAQGVLVGRWARVDGVRLSEFRGIPYAAPPVGRLRWRPPQPASHWSGARDARRFGPRCMQLPLFGDMVFRSEGMSEDCLYLNVWASVVSPVPGAARPRPVLVYFFGGGFVGGDGSERRYDGASLAARGIVMVTVNYRLGVFGFFALPALAAESPRHAAGNYGLLDQVAALEWVRANIAAFGGDPTRITIGGESAGAISVSALMASPLSKRWITGAIGESGALIAPLGPKPLAAAERQGAAFAAAVGARSLAALRALPASDLLRMSGPDAMPKLEFYPDVDGYFLTEDPAATFARGAQAHVPLLVGSNSEEQSSRTVLGGEAPTAAHYAAALVRLFGPLAGRAAALYPGGDRTAVLRSATALAGDLFIAHSTWAWMDLQRRTGRAPVYYYYFDRARPAKRNPAKGERPDTGAVHSGEIEYALGNLATNRVYAWTPTDYRVSRAMEGYFARFVATGDPNGAGRPHWPAVRAAGGGLLRETIGGDTHATIDREAARQTFLTRFFADHPSP
ncbi:MAG TPA: carboxylesterase family protein [Steroidobacteraceae bacterium]|nr:carboxylesterase family protein [Steroidobacteraceae bacterium]